MNIRSVKVSLHNFISGERGQLRNIREQAFAPEARRQLRGGSVITVCGNERGFMYAFLLLDLNLTFSRTLVLRCETSAPFLYIQQSAAVSERYCSLLPTKCSASVSRRLISVFQTTSWLIIYLDRDVCAPNAPCSSSHF